MLGVLILSMFTGMASAADKDAGNPVAEVRVTIDGEYTSLSETATVKNSQTYVPIEDVSAALGATAHKWNGNTLTVTAPDLTIEIDRFSTFMIANGRYLFAEDGFYLQGGKLMVPVRLLAKAFDAAVIWATTSKTVQITSGSGAIVPGSEFYGADDLLWLSRIITAEARGESMTGKIAVGNVIMNRVESTIFPNTIYNVIFDMRSGIQFTPAYTGAVYCTPTADSEIAAKVALDGGNVADDSLYFANTSKCWAGRNRPFTMTIGNHYFYA